MKWIKQRIPPSTKSIEGMIHADDMSLRRALQELISNALDQNAKHIDIVLQNTVLTIADDGNGCGNLRDMLRLGEHFSSGRKPTIGRFGVGFKDAVIWLGDYTKVEDMTIAGKRGTAIADWQHMIKLGDWEAAFGDDSSLTSHGVTITVSQLRKPRFEKWDQLPEHIQDLFSAAIDAGVMITFDGLTIQSRPEPELEERLAFHGNLKDLHFSGFAGILLDRSIRSGWEVRWGPLTIIRGFQKEGFGSYSAQGFFGRLYLEGHWTLARNKTQVEELAAVLNHEQMQNFIRPILEKLHNRGQTLQMKLNQKLANNFCERFLQNVKGTKTDILESTGGRESTGGGRGVGNHTGDKPRRKRKPDAEGNTREKLQKANNVEVWPTDTPRDGMGYCQISEGGKIIKIYVDRHSAFGETLWKTSEGAFLLPHYALSLLAIHLAVSPEEPEFNFVKELDIKKETEDALKIAQVWTACFKLIDLDYLQKGKVAA